MECAQVDQKWTNQWTTLIEFHAHVQIWQAKARNSYELNQKCFQIDVLMYWCALNETIEFVCIILWAENSLNRKDTRHWLLLLLLLWSLCCNRYMLMHSPTIFHQLCRYGCGEAHLAVIWSARTQMIACRI